MAHDKVHVICENLCLEEGMTKTQIESKFATKEVVNSLASGSPKGSYATVSALESANPDTGVYIVNSNGHIYSWTKDGTNAIDLGQYRSDVNWEILNNHINNIDNYQLSLPRASSVNLFSKKYTNVQFGYWQTGNFFDSGGYLWFKLNVKENTQYTIKNWVHHICYFKADGTWLSDFSAGDGATHPDYTITTPNNAAFMHVTVKVSDFNVNDYYVVKGNQIPQNLVSSDILYTSVFGCIYVANKNCYYDVDTSKLIIPNTNIVTSDGEMISVTAQEVSISGTDWIVYNKLTGQISPLSLNSSVYLKDIKLGKKSYVILGYLVGATKEVRLFGLDRPVYTKRKRKIAFLGDSITAGVNTVKTYHMYIQDKYGYSCKNYGIGGTGWSNTISGSSLGGNGNEGLGANNNYSGNNAIKNIIQTIDNTVSLISIFAGTNDYGASVALDTFKNDVETALNYCMENYPTIPVVILSPLRRYYKGSGSTWVDGETPNQQGLKLSDYVEALKEEAAKYGCKFVDFYNNLPLGKLEFSEIRNHLAPDGLHPNTNGHLRIARDIELLIPTLVEPVDWDNSLQL